MKPFFSVLFSLSSLCGPFCLPTARAQTVPGNHDAAPKVVSDSPSARVVSYSERDVVSVKAKVRYTTLIVLPKNESILDFTCGDKEFWIVNGTANFAYVKPAKASSETNLNLITASGNVYSFVLREVSDSPGAQPDLKVFIEPKEESMLSALNGAPKFVPASQLDDFRQQVEIARAEARDAKKQAQATIDSEVSQLRADYPAKMRYDYQFRKNEKPFLATAMYHDDRFTYIRASPEETPALYELKDGKPNLITFDYKDGLFTVSKILDSGYLAIGKKKLNFTREE